MRTKFTSPAPDLIGNTGRNFFLEPRCHQTDVSLSKRFQVTERFSFDLRVGARNLTNTPSLGVPTATLTSMIFGRINDTVNNNARRIQFSGKINF